MRGDEVRRGEERIEWRVEVGQQNGVCQVIPVHEINYAKSCIILCTPYHVNKCHDFLRHLMVITRPAAAAIPAVLLLLLTHAAGVWG